jgi:hypothetical protein
MSRYNEARYNETIYNVIHGRDLRVEQVTTSQYRKINTTTSQYRNIKVTTGG